MREKRYGSQREKDKLTSGSHLSSYDVGAWLSEKTCELCGCTFQDLNLGPACQAPGFPYYQCRLVVVNVISLCLIPMLQVTSMNRNWCAVTVVTNSSAGLPGC